MKYEDDIKCDLSASILDVKQEVVKQEKVKRKKSTDRSKDYLNNEVLHRELCKYKETGEMSEELGAMFELIATRVSTHRRFYLYTYRDELIRCAVARMVMFGHKFDVSRPNAFSYFTTIARNEMFAFLNSERKLTNVRERCRESLWDSLVDREDLNNNESYIKKISVGE